MNLRKAFTLLELLVVIAILAVLSCMVLPALARAKIKSPSAGCLSNLRQLMVGWSLYKEENHDTLMLNGLAGTFGWISCTNASSYENWGSNDGNTNIALLLSGLMGPYVQNDPSVFRCPADVVPSQNGQRLRSYSMNSQMGLAISQTYNPGFLTYLKGSDLICPTPANAFVFCDEHPGSINDGCLIVDSSAGFADVPASYMGGACGFSFADGHAEIHKWVSLQLLLPVFQGESVSVVGVNKANSDVQWFSEHDTCSQ